MLVSIPLISPWMPSIDISMRGSADALERAERARDLGRRTCALWALAAAWRRALDDARRREDGLRGGSGTDSFPEDMVCGEG